MPRFDGIPVEEEKKSRFGGGDPVSDLTLSDLVAGRAKPKKPEVNPLVYALGQQNDFRRAAVHHGMNALHGGAQLLQRGIAGSPTLALIPGAADYARGVVERDDAGLRQREAEYQANSPETTGTYAGAVAGEVLPWMTGMGELRALGVLPKLKATKDVVGAGSKVANVAKKTGLLAGEGAAYGASQPVLDEGSYGLEKAKQVAVNAVAAPVTMGLLKTGGAVIGAGRQALRYVTDAGRETIANSRVAKLLGEDALPQLRAASSGDFVPTSGQAIGTPKAVQAERVLRNNGLTAPAFAAQESANNAALREQVARVAGTDADVAAAKAARKAATDPYYAQLPGQRVDAAPVLQQLDALAASGLGVRPNIKTAAASLRAEIESRLGSDGKIGADILSGLHENAGSHLGPMASAQEKHALGPIRDSIADALDAAVPGFRANLAAYAHTSQPLTDMAAGRSLLGAIDSGARDAGSNQAVSLTQVKALLSKDDRAKFKMSPQARKALEAVRDALQQRSITNNTVAASGPGTAADSLRGLSSSPFAQRVIGQVGGLIGATVGNIPGYAAGTLASEGLLAADRAVTKKVGQKAANSLLAAEAIEAYQREQAKRSRGLLGDHGMPKYLLPYITE